jgi:hypothetical protein
VSTATVSTSTASSTTTASSTGSIVLRCNASCFACSEERIAYL